MRNVLKAETLERKFPLLAVEHGCIVSKDADLTVAFEVLLPEIYTVTGSEYEAIHSAWVKAVRVLPDYSVVCKQDWFMKETYRPDFGGEGQSFLAGSYERHFNERPYLNHRCYLYLTKTTRERSRRRSDFSTLCRGAYSAQGDYGQGDGVPFSGSRGTVRADNERFRSGVPTPHGHRRDYRQSQMSGAGGEVLLALDGRGRHGTGRPLPRTRRDAYR